MNFFVTLSPTSPTSSVDEDNEVLNIGLTHQTALANAKTIDEVKYDDEEEIPEYLNEAATMIKKAAECESEERFDESVAFYRRAIGTLLTNLAEDKCLQRQASVKRRIGHKNHQHYLNTP